MIKKSSCYGGCCGGGLIRDNSVKTNMYVTFKMKISFFLLCT